MRFKVPQHFVIAPLTGAARADLGLIQKVFHRIRDDTTSRLHDGAVQPVIAYSSASVPGPRAAGRSLDAWKTQGQDNALSSAEVFRPPGVDVSLSAHGAVSALDQLTGTMPSNQLANLLSGIAAAHIEAIKTVARESGTVIVLSKMPTQSTFWAQYAARTERADRNHGSGRAVACDSGEAARYRPGVKERSSGSQLGAVESGELPALERQVIDQINARIGQLKSPVDDVVRYGKETRDACDPAVGNAAFFVFPDGRTLMSTSAAQTRAVEQALARADFA